jgi:hypothetical protein
MTYFISQTSFSDTRPWMGEFAALFCCARAGEGLFFKKTQHDSQAHRQATEMVLKEGESSERPCEFGIAGSTIPPADAAFSTIVDTPSPTQGCTSSRSRGR